MAVQVSLNLFSIPCRFKENALNVIFGSVSWSVVVFDVPLIENTVYFTLPFSKNLIHVQKRCLS